MMAQDGIQSPRNTDEDRSAMVKNLLRSVRGLASREMIISFVDHIHETKSYILKLGFKLDHDKDGAIIRRIAAAYAIRRIP